MLAWFLAKPPIKCRRPDDADGAEQNKGPTPVSKFNNLSGQYGRDRPADEHRRLKISLNAADLSDGKPERDDAGGVRQSARFPRAEQKPDQDQQHEAIEHQRNRFEPFG